MEIYCTSCQKKLQIADSFAGQMVQCPSCGATFQAPALPLPGLAPLPEPIQPSVSITPTAVPVAPVTGGTQPPAAEPMRFDAGTQPPRTGELSKSSTWTLRHDVTASIPPIGVVLLFVLSFFGWRFIASAPMPHTVIVDTLSRFNLWELAFSSAGFAVFLIYVLLLIVAIPVAILSFCFERNIVPTPGALRPYVQWGPIVAANLILASWIFFLIHYVQCTLFEPPDLATFWMKLAFRLHAVVVAAAFLDLWLRNRARRGLPEPRIVGQW